jgi:transposase
MIPVREDLAPDRHVVPDQRRRLELHLLTVPAPLSSAIKDRPLRRLKDLRASGQTVELWWRKRRLLCGEGLCPRRSFTQTAAAVRPRGRVTERLRDKLATAIATSNRSVTDVAAEPGVSWPTAHRALVTAAAR